MNKDVIYIPLDRKIYDQIIISTKGTLNPFDFASEAITRLFSDMVDIRDDIEVDENYIAECSIYDGMVFASPLQQKVPLN